MNLTWKIIDLESVKRWLKDKLSLIQSSKLRWLEQLPEWIWKLILALLIVLFLFPRSFIDSSNTFCFPAQPPFLYIPESGQDWLDFRSRKLSFVGRTQELGELNKFLKSESRFSWWWLNGGAGSGKSRIALEWVLLHWSRSIPCLAIGYDAGFFRDVRDENYWLAWQPRRATLIVIDDASEHSERIVQLLKYLGQRSPEFSYPVRILLVERTIPEKLRQLDEQLLYTEHQYRREPLKLYPLTTGELEKLGREVAALRGRTLKWTDQQKKQILTISQGLPLFMILAIDSFLENNGSVRWETKEDFVREQTKRTRAKLVQAGIPEGCLPLLAMASLTRYLRWDTAQRFINDPACENKQLLDRLYGRDTAGGIPAIEPAVLGESFLLEEFANLNEARRALFLQVAWDSSPKEVADTLYKIARDFRNQFRSGGLDMPPTITSSLAWWAQVRAWLLSEENLPLTDIRFYWMQLNQLLQSHMREILINRVVATGALWGIRDFGDLQLLGEMKAVQQTLESIGDQYSTDLVIQNRVALGLAHAVAPYGRGNNVQALKRAFDKLELISFRFPADPEIQTWFAMGTANAINYYQNSSYTSEIPRLFNQIKSLSHRFREHSFLQLLALASAGHAISAFGDMQLWAKIDDAFSFAKAIASNYKDQPQFQKILAGVAANAIHNYGQGHRLNEVNKCVVVLQEVRQRFAGNLGIQQMISKGLLNGIIVYNNNGATENIPELFSGLQNASDHFPKDTEIQLNTMKAAANVLVPLYVRKRETVQLEQVLRMTSRISNDFLEHTDIQLNYVRIIGDLVSYYVAIKQLDKVDQHLRTLKSKANEFPTVITFQTVLAFGFTKALQAYGQEQRFERMEEAFSSLKQLSANFPDVADVQHMLGLGLSEAAGAYRVGGHLQKMNTVVSELEAVSKRLYSDSEMAWFFARGLNEIIRADDKNSHSAYSKLRTLALQFPQNEKLQIEFVGGMVNRMIRLYQNKDRQIFYEFDSNLRAALDAGNRFPTSSDIQLPIVKAMSIALGIYASKRDIGKMEASLITVQRIATSFPNNAAIQSEFALAGANAVSGFIAARSLAKALRVITDL